MAKRTIEVETDVYAAIWADRKPGEDTEDEILARKYGVQRLKVKPVALSDRVGWADPRHGVELKEGQQIFRTYKGREYRATATDGYLVRTDNNVKYNSLNQLSRSIHDNVENAWNNWYVALKDGQRQLITGLRK
ncbi:hypothetical protein M2232_009251 [Bradyrhizobium japonicum]|uniref:hypothetical protein n=1 Tax=Bradyrhizobium japonicum TaxID=375 RepID=UPI0022264917|nr:hypothetical protein [Bradyrhizobium japonicum]MCW2225719.1 hypothetical protein [Bradyrhizobium japonicum]MCW2340931.1 hypothetical protein [Bradyrhizobium japonicum]